MTNTPSRQMPGLTLGGIFYMVLAFTLGASFGGVAGGSGGGWSGGAASGLLYHVV